MVERFIPNVITIIRLLAIPPATYLIWAENYFVARYLFAFAGISDVMDGYLQGAFTGNLDGVRQWIPLPIKHC